LHEKFILEIEIPGLPPLTNAQKGHWSVRRKSNELWKRKTASALVGRAPRCALPAVRVTYTRYSSAEPDFDGLVSGFKYIQDSLVRFGFVENDKMQNIRATYLWEKAKRGEGKIKVRIEEI